MEDTEDMIESMLEKATAYSKTSFELIKLKTIDKTTDVASTIIPHSVVFIVIMLAILFLSLGLAIMLDDIYDIKGLGFFAVAAFYGFLAFILRFILYKWIKRSVRKFLNKEMLQLNK